MSPDGKHPLRRPPRAPRRLCSFAVAWVMLAACGGTDLIQEAVTSDGREVRFPTQSTVIGPRQVGRGFSLGFYAEFSSGIAGGILIEDEGCLRLWQDNSLNYVVIWPAGYHLTVEGDALQVTDKEGELRAIVGDVIAVPGIDTGSAIKLARFMSGPESIKLMRACDGPYWLADGYVELIQAMEVLTPSAASVESMLVVRARDGRELILPRQASIHIYYSGELPGPGGMFNAQLIEFGGCIRAGSPTNSYVVIWPPGFEIKGEAEWVVILNEAGQPWAAIGDMVVLGGHEVDTVEELASSIPEPYASMVAAKCSGPYWILSDPVQLSGPRGN